jgi:hypothetical protein
VVVAEEAINRVDGREGIRTVGTQYRLKEMKRNPWDSRKEECAE